MQSGQTVDMDNVNETFGLELLLFSSYQSELIPSPTCLRESGVRAPMSVLLQLHVLVWDTSTLEKEN